MRKHITATVQALKFNYTVYYSSISVLALGLGASCDTQPSFQAEAYSEAGLHEKSWEPNHSV